MNQSYHSRPVSASLDNNETFSSRTSISQSPVASASPSLPHPHHQSHSTSSSSHATISAESLPTMNVMYLCSSHLSMNPVHVFKSITTTSFAQKELPMIFGVTNVRPSGSNASMDLHCLIDDSSAMYQVKTIQFSKLEDAAMFGRCFNTSATTSENFTTATGSNTPGFTAMNPRGDNKETLQTLRSICATNTNDQFCRIAPAFIHALPMLGVVHNTIATRNALNRIRFGGDPSDRDVISANRESELIICEFIDPNSLVRNMSYDPRIVNQHLQLEKEVQGLQNELRTLELEKKFKSEIEKSERAEVEERRYLESRGPTRGEGDSWNHPSFV